MKQIKLTAMTLVLVSMGTLFGDASQVDCSPCYKVRQCAKNTLYTDGFNIRFHSGASPIFWKKRGCISFLSTAPATCSENRATNCNAHCVTPFFIESFKCASNCATNCAKTAISSIRIPKFNKLFRTPWTIGATLGYAIDTHQELVLQFNYTEAPNRHDFFAANVSNTAAVPVLLHINLSKYKNAGAYIGYRYNFDRMRCFPRDFLGDMSWFLGIKVGMLHHYAVRGFVASSFTSVTNSSTRSSTPSFDLFKSSTSFSGIAEVGVDICLNCDWSLMIAADVVAARGPSCHRVVIPVTELSSHSIHTAKIGAEILLPVTFGLRYKF